MRQKINSFLKRFSKQKVVASRRVHKNFPDWSALLGTESSLPNKSKRPAHSPKVLLATSIGGDAPSATIESLLGVALALRGAIPEVLLCDSALPACLRGNVNNYPDEIEFVRAGPKERYCQGCFENSEGSFSSAGIAVHRYSNFISEKDRKAAASISAETPFEEIANFQLEGMSVGEHAAAGALRFFARGTLEGEPNGEVVLRRFFEAALLTTYAINALFEREKYDVVVFSHGIYIPLGIVGEVARKKGIRVVNWVTAYRKQRFIFSHGDTYHHTMISEPVKHWDDIPWTQALEERTMAYLESRTQGTRDWIWFHEKPEEEMAKIARELGLDPGKPIIGLLTNVVWDAQLHFKANAFANMLDWIMETIKYFTERKELQLVIRVHPAEIRGTVKSRQRVMDEISKRFGTLPPNIFVIGPESPISTYAAMEACDSVIIYGTKTGVELIARGIPVIVAGEAWVRNKGLTSDANTQEEYSEILDRLPFGKRLDRENVSRARKYAYHFFFRRMIPLPMVIPNEGFPPFKISLKNGTSDLMPGSSFGLDVICQGILEGKPFIYQDEIDCEPQID